LGLLALERRRPDESDDHLAAAQAHLQAAGGDPLTAANIEVLRAQVAARRGDREAALAIHARAREALTAAVGPGHPRTLELDADLADLEAELHRHAQVLALAEAALRRLTAGDARTALARARAYDHAALALQGLGRPD